MNQWVDINVLANDTVQNSAPLLIYSVGSPANGTAVITTNSALLVQ